VTTTYAPQRRIVAVGPLCPGWGRVMGTVQPVTLECGHTYQGNATAYYRLGTHAPCHTCKRAAT
jgi:hypothetical protein